MMDKNCRLCLKSDEGNYINIFGDEGISLSIASILTHHFWFEAKDCDNHSKYICSPCWINVESFHVFYMQIYNAHDKLVSKLDIEEIKIEEIDRSALASTETEMRSESTTIMEIIPEKIGEVEDDILIEEFVDDSADGRNSEEHEIDQKDDKRIETDIKQTGKCSQECPDTTSDKPCKRKKPNEEPSTANKRRRNKDETEQIESEDKQIRESFEMKCELCTAKFQIFYDVKVHYRVAHGMNGYLICCNKKFFKRCYVLQHIQRHLNPDIFKCEICNKTYLEKRGLQNHMNKHVPITEKPYKCEKCPQAFAKKFLLTQHQLRHMTEEDKHFFCTECGKSFASNSILQSHKRGVHEGAYIHVCEICAKSFKSKLFYNTHMKSVHSVEGIPKVQCSVCKIWLKHAHSLRSHMARHEDATKEHKCNICGKLSPNRGALRSHQRYVHLNDRIHKCSVCGKAFKKMLGLKEHMPIHTGEVLYSCPHCTKTFNSSANMHSHRKRVHHKEWEENRRKKFVGNLPVKNS